MEDVRKKLGIIIESPYWDESFEKAIGEIDVPEWLTEGYLFELEEECALFPKTFDALISAAKSVRKKPDLCLLAKTIYHILEHKEGFSKSFAKLRCPSAPEDEEDKTGYDSVLLFPVVAHLRPTWNELSARGIEDEILSDSLRWIDLIFDETIKRLKKTAFDETAFKMYGVGIYVNHLVIGRLRFEIHQNSSRPAKIFQNKEGDFCVLMENVRIHRSGLILGAFGCQNEEGSFDAEIAETEESYEGYAVDNHTRLVQNFKTVLLKNEWTPVYSSGDCTLKVHIPVGGGLQKEKCESSYQRARELFKRCYPEYCFTGFLINCWMLSPVLKNILPKDSNIISFQEKYHSFPSKDSAKDAFLYVYGIKDTPVDEICLEDLPEDNSLMRGIKYESMKGNFVHQFNGFFPWGEAD